MRAEAHSRLLGEAVAADHRAKQQRLESEARLRKMDRVEAELEIKRANENIHVRHPRRATRRASPASPRTGYERGRARRARCVCLGHGGSSPKLQLPDDGALCAGS